MTIPVYDAKCNPVWANTLIMTARVKHCLMELIQWLMCINNFTENRFQCGQTNLYVPRKKVCDMKNDCGNWDDENTCGKVLPFFTFKSLIYIIYILLN